MKKGSIKFIVFIAFLVAAVLAVKYLGLGEYLDQARLRAWIDGFGSLGPAVYILFYSIAPALLLPGLPTTVLGGVLFGPVWGIVYAATGGTIGACVAFLISRYMGREWVEGIITIKGGKFENLDKDVERQGWKIVAFTRLIPLFPFNLLNYAFGLTRIKFTQYAWASLVFMLPGVTAYVVFSSSLLDLIKGKVSPEFLIGIVLVIIISLIPIIYKKRKAGTTTDKDL